MIDQFQLRGAPQSYRCPCRSSSSTTSRRPQYHRSQRIYGTPQKGRPSQRSAKRANTLSSSLGQTYYNMLLLHCYLSCCMNNMSIFLLMSYYLMSLLHNLFGHLSLNLFHIFHLLSLLIHLQIYLDNMHIMANILFHNLNIRFYYMFTLLLYLLFLNFFLLHLSYYYYTWLYMHHLIVLLHYYIHLLHLSKILYLLLYPILM